MTDHDMEECEEHPEPQGYIMRWDWSNWDLAGVTTTTVAGLFFAVGQGFSVIGQGLNLLAREFSAKANYERHQYELAYQEAQNREAVEAYHARQLEMAAELRGIVEGPEEEEDPSE